MNGKLHQLIFHIINGPCKAIIEYKCSLDLGMLKMCGNSMNAQKSNGAVDSILYEYKDRFEGF